MKSWNISEFREQCLTLLDRLPVEGILVTRRGKPIAKMMPVRKDNRNLIGSMAGQFEIRGDVLSTGERRDAES